MYIRKFIHKNQALTIIVVLGVVVAGVWMNVRSLAPKKQLDASKAFYTVDDGATFFIDDSKKIPPFDHNGKTAVRAHVFECYGKQAVGYMSRYTPRMKQVLETNKTAPGSLKPEEKQMLFEMEAYIEMKKPGAPHWSVNGNFGYKCADNTYPEIVNP